MGGERAIQWNKAAKMMYMDTHQVVAERVEALSSKRVPIRLTWSSGNLLA